MKKNKFLKVEKMDGRDQKQQGQFKTETMMLSQSRVLMQDILHGKIQWDKKNDRKNFHMT